MKGKLRKKPTPILSPQPLLSLKTVTLTPSHLYLSIDSFPYLSLPLPLSPKSQPQLPQAPLPPVKSALPLPSSLSISGDSPGASPLFWNALLGAAMVEGQRSRVLFPSRRSHVLLVPPLDHPFPYKYCSLLRRRDNKGEIKSESP